MTRTASTAALLHVALQDLHAGLHDQAARLPAIADRASEPELVALLTDESARADADAATLAATIDTAGPDNLWMAGILDDAERDTTETQAGRLLDIALVGAIRKAKAAEIVSFETAIALARETGTDDLATLAEGMRERSVAADRALAARLAALTSPRAASA